MAGSIMKRNRFQKGQATVEFILVIVISLAYLGAVVMPNAEVSTDNVTDISNLAKLRVSADKFVNAIQYVSLSGEGTKQTVELVVPAGGTFTCANQEATTSYIMESKSSAAACRNDDDALNPSTCTKDFPIGISFTCENSSGNVTANWSYGTYLAEVEKSSGNIVATISVIE